MGHVEGKKGSGRRGSCTLCVLGIAVTLQREALESRGSTVICENSLFLRILAASCTFGTHPTKN